MDQLEQRIDDLEMRLAHQDKAVADLNEVVTAQWKKLEAMDRQLRRFYEELEAQQASDAPAADQKPPHY
jgi:SlyX protein